MENLFFPLFNHFCSLQWFFLLVFSVAIAIFFILYMFIYRTYDFGMKAIVFCHFKLLKFYHCQRNCQLRLQQPLLLHFRTHAEYNYIQNGFPFPWTIEESLHVYISESFFFFFNHSLHSASPPPQTLFCHLKIFLNSWNKFCIGTFDAFKDY